MGGRAPGVQEPGGHRRRDEDHAAGAAREASWKQRFLAEARLLATLRHPNIVEVIDYDTLADGTPFLVMALLTARPFASDADEWR